MAPYVAGETHLISKNFIVAPIHIGALSSPSINRRLFLAVIKTTQSKIRYYFLGLVWLVSLVMQKYSFF